MNEIIKLKCKVDPVDEFGEKVMLFTKGKEYTAEKYNDYGDELFAVMDDNGNEETFWELRLMFEIIE